MMRCALLCILETVEGRLCLLDVLELMEESEVMRCVLLCLLGAPKVMRCVLFRMLEGVEGGICLLEVPEVMCCMLLCLLEVLDVAGGDALCAASYAGGCGG